ncbi:hypothetical protein GBA52_005997 [Prunus armeniaca]|nr:hypothetical protein GBA52_005997 [Prunus armeniaca]
MGHTPKLHAIFFDFAHIDPVHFIFLTNRQTAEKGPISLPPSLANLTILTILTNLINYEMKRSSPPSAGSMHHVHSLMEEPFGLE